MALRKFIIERDIPGAGTLEREQLRAAAAKSNEVLRRLGPDIQWVDSYVVAHDEPRSVDQRAGDGDALFLTTGELVRQFAEMRAHADALKDRGSWRCRPCYWHPGCGQRNGCVLGGG